MYLYINFHNEFNDVCDFEMACRSASDVSEFTVTPNQNDSSMQTMQIQIYKV